MSNQERIEMRIARNKAKKAEKRAPAIEKYGRIENVITNQNMFHSLKRRIKTTGWKASVQRYVAHFAVKNKRQVDEIRAGNEPDINHKAMPMKLHERGKARDVCAVIIDSRVVQGCLCDSCITPLTQPSLIYDNPASTAGKGTQHARNRTVNFIQKQIRESGVENAYAYQYDFKGFFASILHSECEDRLRKAGLDKPLRKLTMYFIRMYQIQAAMLIRDKEQREQELERIRSGQAKGVTLGSQISQDMALVIPNPLDHFFKDVMGIKRHARYMDDGLTLCTGKELPKFLMGETERICNKIGLVLNKAKTRIVKLTRGFTFLKVRYVVSESRKIIRRIARSGIIRMRRHLKKFRDRVNKGLMTLDDVFLSVSSWLGNARKSGASYKSRKSIVTEYFRLFHGYRMEGKAI